MSTMPPVVDPRFEPGYEQPESAKPKRSFWANCLIGCLFFVAVLVVLGVVVAYWVSQKWRGWTANLGSQVFKQAIAESDFPQQEKDAMNVQIDRLATAFRENRISLEEGSRLMQNLVQSPLMTSFMVSAIDRRYLARSGLSDEEKAEGRVTLRRFIRGMVDKSISEQGIDSAMQHVATRNANGGWEIRRQITDTDLQAFLTAAKAEADTAGIPAEAEQIDPSDELKRIIDQSLGEPAVEREPASGREPSAEPDQK